MQLREKMEKYHIESANIYNYDEMAFLMNKCAANEDYIISKSLVQNGKDIRGLTHGGCCRWTSLLSCICADGSVLPPALIYRGKSKGLKKTWLDDFDGSKAQAVFETTARGWAEDELGLAWLKEVFEPSTKDKAGSSWRLLLMDNYVDNICLEVLEYCISRRIIVALLPPDSSRVLSPLDLGIYPLLDTAYSSELDRLNQSGQTYNNMTKREFWPIFKVAWNKALTYENVRSAFSATGIEPLNPARVLDPFKKTSLPGSEGSQAESETSDSIQIVKRGQKAVLTTSVPLPAEAREFLEPILTLSLNFATVEQHNRQLAARLIEGRKHWNKGKYTELLAPDQQDQATSFSPAEIATVPDLPQTEARKSQHKLDKENKRLGKRTEKDRKTEGAKSRRIKVTEQPQSKGHKAQEVMDGEVHAQGQSDKSASQVSTRTRKRKSSDGLEQPQKPNTRVARSGCSVVPPVRFGQ
jgi:hypothetical protein